MTVDGFAAKWQVSGGNERARTKLLAADLAGRRKRKSARQGRARVLGRSVVLALSVAAGTGTAMPAQSPECRIDGALPAPLVGRRTAICSLLTRAAAGRASVLVVTFRRPETLAVRAVGYGGAPYPELAVSESDRRMGFDTVRTLAKALAEQLN
jgi:hypothetical protein